MNAQQKRQPRTRIAMKHNVLLRITSLLSILLLTLHVTDDIVRGISKAEPSNTALVVLVVWLYGTLGCAPGSVAGSSVMAGQAGDTKT